jgi:hypothetical protein
MGTIAVRRTLAVALATLLAVVAYLVVAARSAEADVPAQPGSSTSADEGKPHRPVIDSGVKFVRNADGTVTQTR